MTSDPTRLTIDRDARGYRYYRNAVERHWDPADVDLGADAEALAAADPAVLDGLRAALGKFGAGEQAVTGDLAPLAQVLDPVEDQLFVTTQLYEEAKHADFFDRYWREVIHETEDAMGLERSSPTDPSWFNEAYDELFERNERAMARLLEDDTPENRVRAYCHYHLIVEGVLAQTGYYGLTRVFGGEVEESPHLPGLVDGLNLIRGDEGRHVGFGMAKLKALVQAGVDPALIHEVTDDLLALVQEAVQTPADVPEQAQLVDPAELTAYAAEKHAQRLRQITDADESIPGVEELTALDA
ncbi:ribonucleoside-diphosphate reductase [Halobacteriales archaeon QS_1_68_20]|nr:MAG: ribonucleoside-diphosphate reductase [Halobacteriales archaeon QS_1_68_20]